MSATGTRMTLAYAKEFASAEIFDHIQGERYLAGSIRRERPDIGDIEIVVHRSGWIRLDVGGGSLFPAPWMTIKGGKPNWRHWQLRHQKTGIVLDLYRFDDLNRGSQMLIRTGPAEFSKRFVMALRDCGYEHKDGYVRSLDEQMLMSCPTETTAFKLAGMTYVEPEDRT